MKRIILFIIYITICSVSMMTVMAEEEQPPLSVEVHADGSFTVTTIVPEEDKPTNEYNNIFVYSKESLDRHNQEGTPLYSVLWWVAVPDEPLHTHYPGATYFGKEYLRYPNEDAPEFVDGPRSALRPGIYYVVFTGYHKTIAGPIEFEIPEITETPTPAPTSTPTLTKAPTKLPTKAPESTEIPTAAETEIPSKAPNPTVSPAPAETPGAAESNGKSAVLWICIGAAAVVAAGIIAVVLVKRKK